MVTSISTPFHAGQYTIFLYFYSREVFLSGSSLLADKIYFLNKIMSSCNLFYAVELPDFFMLDNPQGTVMGRAKYSDGLSFPNIVQSVTQGHLPNYR